MFHPHGRGSKANIINSEIINYFNYGSDDIYFENTYFKGSIKFLWEDENIGPGTIGGTSNTIFENCTANLRYINIAMNQANISGTIEFKEVSLNDIKWEKGTIKELTQ